MDSSDQILIVWHSMSILDHAMSSSRNAKDILLKGDNVAPSFSLHGHVSWFNTYFGEKSKSFTVQSKLKRLAGSKRNKRWYREYFHNQNHTNYVGFDPKLGPVIVSILQEKGCNKSFNVRVISRTKTVRLYDLLETVLFP